MTLKSEPIFLEPIFQERVWGGNKLQELFNYPLESSKIGECWAISAHDHGTNHVKSGVYKGKTVKELWDNHREIFGSPTTDKFPLLVKILDARDDLSIQVHPNNQYAKEVENDSGKTECWYVLECKQDAKLIYGHHAKTKQDLRHMVNNHKWQSLLKEIPIQSGDFFYVPSGTVHALCSGTIVLEIQQSSDVTYRLYDYDRLDQDRNLRELHIQKALDVISVPNRDVKSTTTTYYEKGGRIQTLLKNEYFSVYRWNVQTKMTIKGFNQYVLSSVVQGKGILRKGQEVFPMKKGDHFILPFDYGDFTVEGRIEIIVASPPKFC